MNNKRRNQFIFLCLVMVAILNSCQTAQSETELPTDETWDLLWISDSSGWGVAQIYGEMIAKDNGVEVNVRDMWKGGLAVGRILRALNEGDDIFDYDLKRIRDYIREAEVIVIYGNPEKSKDSNNPWDWNCGQGFGDCYVNACSMDTFDTYIDQLKEIYQHIFQLRKGKATIVRAIDAYNPVIQTQCSSSDMVNTCIACWENYNTAIHQAADEMGVPVVPVFDTWNGPDHTEDPNDKGFTQTDGTHPNHKGAEVIAQLLRETGYTPIIP